MVNTNPLRKFLKGDAVQLETSPTVYRVTRDETATGILRCTREGRNYVFNTNTDAVSLAAEQTPDKPKGEWWDTATQQWLSTEGYEVCQDHTGPRATCPYNHHANRRP